MFIIFTSWNACRSSDGGGEWYTRWPRWPVPNTGPLSSLIHFRHFTKIFTGPHRQGLHAGDGAESITLQRLLMMLGWLAVAMKEGLIWLLCPWCSQRPKSQAPHWAPKVLQWCSPLPKVHWGIEPATYAGPG